MKRIVILGAGVTGLAAADRLLELGGCEVTVLEVEPHVGGLAATIVRDDVATDLGPHRIHTELPEVRDLLPELVGNRLLNVRRSSRMFLDGRWLSYPLRASEVLRALGPATVLRFGAGLIATRFSGLMIGGGRATFAETMKRAFGLAAYRKVFEPYARKVWRTDPSQLSAEIARVRLPDQGPGAAFGRLFRRGKTRRAGPLREFLYVRGGIGELCESLADRIQRRGGRIFIQSRAVALNVNASAVAAVTVLQPTATLSLEADAVISTIPLPSLGGMLPVDDREVRAALAGLEYLSVILVILVAAKDHIGPDHWLYFPHEPPMTTRACEPKNFDPALAPPGKTWLCCEITARHDEPLWERGDGDLAEQVKNEMSATGLFQKREIASRFVIRKDWAYPIYRLGFERTLEGIWPFLSRFANLVSVGRQGLFNHNNIDHSLVMGRRAAELVIAKPAPAPEWYRSLGQFKHFRIID